mgnify:CR=1 FL=1
MTTECERRLKSWREDPFFDAQTRAETAALTDEAEIEDRFGSEMTFGTAGLRGLMGAGTNRMNRYTVRRATKGLAGWLIASEGEATARRRGVVIAFDSRFHSADFAEETALTLCADGIPAYCFPVLTPTPVLSFAVRHLGCCAGVMITASHNPKEYNGYKVFDRDGCQLLERQADAVLARAAAVPLTSVVPMDRAAALSAKLLRSVDPSVLDAFLDAAAAQSHTLDSSAKRALRVVYSPLHGAGSIPVRRILERQGYQNVLIVPEQEKPDGAFPTVAVPNPEDREALTLGVRLAAVRDADLVIATDPDCDRVTISALHNGLYQNFTGNQLGALLANYIFTRRADRLTSASVLVKTIVSGELAPAVARAHGVRVVEVPTGFKYIGDQIRRCESDPELEFIMGYEESCGFLIGTHALDKDAVGTCLLICEMAAYYKSQGLTLIDVLSSLYEQYGYHMSVLDTYTITGHNWKEKVRTLMAVLRLHGRELAGGPVTVLDYATGIGGLPRCDVLKFCFEDGSWMAVRPSGTEPKIKIYHSTRQKDRAAAERSIAAHRKAVLSYLAPDIPE